MCLAGTTDTVHRHPHDSPGPSNLSRRALLGASAGAAVAVALPRAAGAAPVVVRRSVRDLTHTFRAGFPVYSRPNPIRRTLFAIERDGFYSQEWTFAEHSGTHVDVPGHFVRGGRLAPAITPEELFPAGRHRYLTAAAADPDAQVTPDDLQRFERRNGRIPRGAGVFMYSGWEARVGDQNAYRNADANGTYHFPGFGLAAVEWLVVNRDITCIGVDTLSLDAGNSTTFPVHHTLLGADRYGVENLAKLKSIPVRGATTIVGLVPWEEGSGGPARVLALVR